MRDYKFRGKTKNGEWAYGSLLLINDKTYIREGQYCDLDDIDFGFGFEEVIPETLSQFTGLSDKQGVEIYEGDIVLSKNTFETKMAKVIFLQGSFMCEWLNDDCYSEELSRLIWNHRPYSGDGVMFEVIGNIYDNSDLLK